MLAVRKPSTKSQVRTSIEIYVDTDSKHRTTANLSNFTRKMQGQLSLTASQHEDTCVGSSSRTSAAH
jgi:hypothetical protein